MAAMPGGGNCGVAMVGDTDMQLFPRPVVWAWYMCPLQPGWLASVVGREGIARVVMVGGKGRLVMRDTLCQGARNGAIMVGPLTIDNRTLLQRQLDTLAVHYLTGIVTGTRIVFGLTNTAGLRAVDGLTL